MNRLDNMKPIPRKNFRIKCGKLFYTYKRYIDWHFGDASFATRKMTGSLANQIMTHSTPIYRELRNVDMWLQENKAVNLSIAIKKIDGLVIEPGETFQFGDWLVSPCTEKVIEMA